MNQLNYPYGISIDDDHIIYIANYGNYRVMKWKHNATNGEIVADGNRVGNSMNELSSPTGVIILIGKLDE